MATTASGRRYPEPADTPDVPRDLQRLAADCDARDAAVVAQPAMPGQVGAGTTAVVYDADLPVKAFRRVVLVVGAGAFASDRESPCSGALAVTANAAPVSNTPVYASNSTGRFWTIAAAAVVPAGAAVRLKITAATSPPAGESTGHGVYGGSVSVLDLGAAL